MRSGAKSNFTTKSTKSTKKFVPKNFVLFVLFVVVIMIANAPSLGPSRRRVPDRLDCCAAGGKGSGGIVEDDTQRTAPARVELADAVTELHLIVAARPSHRAGVHREDGSIAFLER